MDDDVDRAELVHCLLEGMPNIRRAGDVRLNSDASLARCIGLTDRLFARIPFGAILRLASCESQEVNECASFLGLLFGSTETLNKPVSLRL
jgi:hypothetical protein